MNFLRLTVAVAAGVMVGGAANASVLAGNAYTFDSTGNGIFSAGESVSTLSAFGESIADNFTLGSGAYAVNAVCFYGLSERFNSPFDDHNVTSFEWNIFADNAGLPGAQIAGGTVAIGGVSITAVDSDGFGDINLYEIGSLNVNMTGGNYHFNVGAHFVGDDDFSDNSWIWSSSILADDTVTATFDDGASYQAFTGFGDMAFAIKGNAVPEPATMAVLGLGAAALLRRRRK